MKSQSCFRSSLERLRSFFFLVHIPGKYGELWDPNIRRDLEKNIRDISVKQDLLKEINLLLTSSFLIHKFYVRKFAFINKQDS